MEDAPAGTKGNLDAEFRARISIPSGTEAAMELLTSSQMFN